MSVLDQFVRKSPAGINRWLDIVPAFDLEQDIAWLAKKHKSAGDASEMLERAATNPVSLLVSELRRADAQPFLFLTWAHRDGLLPQAGMPGFGEMQAHLEDGYHATARDLYLPVVPAGVAWAKSREQNVTLDLWVVNVSWFLCCGCCFPGLFVPPLIQPEF